MSSGVFAEMKETQYRQGDVLLRRVEALPPDVKKRPVDAGRVVLAYGEVTGHAHAIDASFATMYGIEDKDWLVARPGATLCHEEHSALVLDAGVYEVIRQREYQNQGWRRVSD